MTEVAKNFIPKETQTNPEQIPVACLVNLERVREERERKSTYFGCVGGRAWRERKSASIKEQSKELGRDV